MTSVCHFVLRCLFSLPFSSLYFEPSNQHRQKGVAVITTGVFGVCVVCVKERCLDLFGLVRLLGEENRVDVGDHTARSDGGSAEQFVQLLVVADRELNVTRNDAQTLVVARRIAGELENLGRQVLEHRGQVDRSAGANTSCVAALSQMTMHATH